MANIKITDLTAYTDAASTDVLPIVDVGADVTKKIAISDVVKAVPLGTAALPGLAFDGDPNTGIYSPGADQVAISTNGAERLAIESDGDVRFGSSANYGWIRGWDSTTGNMIIGADQSATGTGGSALIFRNRGSETARITSDGKLGLGTSTPGANLDARGTVALSSFLNIDGTSGAPITASWAATSAGGRMLSLSNTAADSSVGQGSSLYQANFSNNQGSYGRAYQVTTNSADKFWVGSDGSAYFGSSVGIGTTSPGSALEVKPSSSLSTIGIQAGTINSDSIRLQAGGTANTYLEYRGYLGHAWFVDSTERARIDSSGRLLVGTSTDVSGGIAGEICQAMSSAGAVLNLGRNTSSATTADQMGGINFYSFAGSSWQKSASILCQADAAQGDDDKPGRLVFSTTADGASSPTERMRIQANGLIRTLSATTTFEVRTQTNQGGTAVFQVANAVTDMTTGGSLVFKIMGDGDAENANNSYTGISDQKLKENIVDAGSQWNDVKSLKVRNYNFKKETGFSSHRQIGLIAQEVELVSPGLVGKSPDRDADGNDLGTVTKSVNYSVLYMKAVKALQEAMERIEVLEAKVNALEGS